MRISAALFRSLFLTLALCFNFGGCSSSSPDIIAPPAAGSPGQTWQDIQQSLNAHSVDGWDHSLAPTFAYVPDPVSAAEFPDAFAAWDREVELAFARALFAADVEIDADLVVNGADCPAPAGSTVTWPNVEYAVVVSGSGGASPVTYRGFADLEFGLEGDLWYLVRWVDLRGAPAPWHGSVICPTLGELRAVYRDQ